LDAAGNRSAKTDDLAGVTSSYTYDRIYELTQVLQGANTTESYSYDPVGNRLSSLGVSSYTNNSSNELTATSNASYTYDYNGNTTSKTDSTGTTSYSWDYENRLTSVTLPNSGGTVTFKYDPFGRRIEKISPTTTSIFAYEGPNVIETVNSSGGVVARYTYGPNMDEPVAESRSGTVSYYEQDALGSVTSLSNATGALAQTYTYDSFGNQTASSGSLTNFFRFTGREFDTETGLYFLRARYLDPTTGRFLSEDPTGFNGGVNFYSYALNRPTQWVDPMGLSAQDVGRILGACKTCTQHLTDEGFRSPGSGRLNGWWNDLTWWFKKKRQSCYGQAQMAQPCLANPTQPYDDPWTFTVVPIEWGTHRVVMGTDPNPNDPLVFCDPWMNRSWTQPKPPTGPTGGGGGW
jgi:RHS repeat-associated protein